MLPGAGKGDGRMEKKTKWTRGTGEFIGFTVIALCITYMVIILASFLQLQFSLSQLSRALAVAGRSAAVCASKEDAKKQALKVVQSSVTSANIDSLEVEVEYAGDRRVWEPGAYLTVTVSGNVHTLEPVTSGVRSKKMLVSVENQNAAGRTVLIPERYGNGLITYTNYTYFYPKWTAGTAQRKIANLWAQKGKASEGGVATIDGYYLLACTTTFGKVGDRVCFVLEDGTRINGIIADSKRTNNAAENSNQYGHRNGQDVIELEVTGPANTATVPGGNSVKPEWRGKRVVKGINFGSYVR